MKMFSPFPSFLRLELGPWLPAVLICCLSPLLVFGQGSLTPPGAPGATMRTLDQVEPRTPVDAIRTPGDANAIFVISQPGSYYLTTNVIGVSGVSGIRIDADNVTLDLNGFALIGVAGTQRGINMTASHQNIAIFNGTVRGWANYGVYTTFGVNCQIHHLRLSQNSFAGLKVGDNSTVSDCVANANAGPGIFVVGSGNRIENNNLNYNTNNGLFVISTGNLIIKNSATYNAGADYNIAAGNSYGQLVVFPGAGFTSATAWANFSSACGAGQTACGGVCVTLTNDVNNCGGCGIVCSSHICVSSACQTATCSDSVKNGNETDVDCGGTCSKCSSGKHCLAGSDCTSGICSSGTCQ